MPLDKAILYSPGTNWIMSIAQLKDKGEVSSNESPTRSIFGYQLFFFARVRTANSSELCKLILLIHHAAKAAGRAQQRASSRTNKCFWRVAQIPYKQLKN